MAVFPVEIFDMIIDCLATDKDTLRQCCLVSNSWFARAKTHLFRELKIRSLPRDIEDVEELRSYTPALERSGILSPSTSSCVQCLSIGGGDYRAAIDANAIHQLLHIFPHVEDLSLSCRFIRSAEGRWSIPNHSIPSSKAARPLKSLTLRFDHSAGRNSYPFEVLELFSSLQTLYLDYCYARLETPDSVQFPKINCLIIRSGTDDDFLDDFFWSHDHTVNLHSLSILDINLGYIALPFLTRILVGVESLRELRICGILQSITLESMQPWAEINFNACVSLTQLVLHIEVKTSRNFPERAPTVLPAIISILSSLSSSPRACRQTIHSPGLDITLEFKMLSTDIEDLHLLVVDAPWDRLHDVISRLQRSHGLRHARIRLWDGSKEEQDQIARQQNFLQAMATAKQALHDLVETGRVAFEII